MQAHQDPTTRMTAIFLSMAVIVGVALLGVAHVAGGGASGVGAGAPPATAGQAPASPRPSATSGAVPADWVRVENARPGTTDWQIPPGKVATSDQLTGFSDAATARPGATVRLYVSSVSPQAQVQAYRVGNYAGSRGRLVWSSQPFATTVQAPAVTDPRTRMVRAPWTASTSFSTSGWPEGLYLLKLVGVGGRAAGMQHYVTLVLRSATTRGRLALVSAITTQTVYNPWGGRSLYGGGSADDFGERSYAASMDRPLDGDGIRKLDQYELGPVWLAESLGLDLAYLTSPDLERPGILDGARGIVSLGHDEYWTVTMRRAVEAARDAGTNLAFLGANAAYWRIRFEDSPLGPDRVVVGYKDAGLDPVARRDPQRATVKFRSDPATDPENSLTGMLYECFPAVGDYVVTDPGFALFARTGVRAGTRIPGLIGAEIDRAYPIPGTPDTLQVVAHSPARCGATGRTFSDSVYFTSGSGAGTFSTGTMGWAIALRGPVMRLGITQKTVDFTRRVTTNLFEAMALGPMARSIAADANLTTLHELRSTRTGTGGPVATPTAR